MSSKRLISRFVVVAAVLAAVAMMGAGSVGAQGVGPSNFPSPNGLNGWYTYTSISGSFSFYVAGLDGYFEEEDGTFDERLTGITCSGGPNLTYTPFTGPPFIPGSPSIPVQKGITISGDSGSAGVGCTASYERWYYHDCHSSIFGDYCNIEGPWVSAGTRSDSRSFKLDSTLPYSVVVHASSSPNANGWYNSPVTFHVSGSDDISGIMYCGFGNFPAFTTPSVTVNTNTTSFGDGRQGGCRDFAGNATSTAAIWKYDSTLPALAPTVSPAGVLLRGSVATAAANATDTPSGIDAANTGCDAVDTSVAGSFTVACHATDRAGNTNTGNAAYKVGFGFTGFVTPVDNDALNMAKAGQAVPLRFHVSDANGPVTNLTGYTLSSSGEACDNSEPTDAIEEYAAGASGLQNLGDGDYQINWKTDKTYAGQCRQVNVTVGGDTTAHSADFKFVK